MPLYEEDAGDCLEVVMQPAHDSSQAYRRICIRVEVLLLMWQ